MQKRPYFLGYPCYVFVEGDDVGPYMVCVDGQTCVALFTFAELLNRFVKQEQVQGSGRSFAGPDELASYLRIAVGRRSTLVTVNPIVTRSVYCIPINELFEDLEQGCPIRVGLFADAEGTARSTRSAKTDMRSRLIQITFFLATQRRVNNKDLQERFGVSGHTIARDLRSVRDAGLNVVYFEKERGYRLVNSDF